MEDQYYILENKQPKRVENFLEQAKWAETANRKVASTELPGGVTVSTYFIGCKAAWDVIPIMFETMIYGGEHDGHRERFQTWEEAEKGHKKAVRLACK